MGAWKDVERTEEAKAFLREYEALCLKHGIKIARWSSRDDAGLLLENAVPGQVLEDDLDLLESERVWVHTYDPAASYEPRDRP